MSTKTLRKASAIASTIATIAILSLFPASVSAEDALTPEQILDKLDKTSNGFADQYMQMTLVIHETDGKVKSYDLTIYQKGDVKRLVMFTSGEIKGMATLVEDPNNVHVYLPGFKKVRRVAAHNMNQSIVGSDLSNEDMATASWGLTFNARLDHEDADAYYLVLTPKKPEESVYAKYVVSIAKKTWFQNGTDFYNAKGELVKKMVAGEPKDFHGLVRYSKVTFSDPRTKHSTDLVLSDFKVNQGYKDDMFSVRQLQMGK